MKEQRPMTHSPQRLRELPPFDGPFDAFKLEAKNCDVLFALYPAGASEIEFWFYELNAKS